MGKLVPNAFNLFVVVFVALGSASSCTYGMAVIGTTIGQPSFFKSLHLAAPGEPGYSLTAQYIGAFNGVSSAGSALGAVFCAYSADKWSRKHTIQGAAMALILGAALCAGSVNCAMFLVSRLINGLGIGALVTAIPMYQAEVSTPEGRGFMVSMHGVMSAVGYGLSAWIGFGVYFITAGGSDSSFPWRFPIAFQIAPALALLIGSPFLPYSPRWLIMKDRNDEAHEVLKHLHRTQSDSRDTLARKEFYQMRKQIEADRQIKATTSKFEIFKTPANRRRALVGFFLLFNNQFTGVLVLANYGIILYESLGMTGYMPLLLTTLMVSSTFPGNLLCAFVVDRYGRRRFMLIGLSCIIITLSIETALEALYLGTNNKTGQDMAILFIFITMTPLWSFFMDAPQFLYTSEIMPTHIRSQGTAVSVAGFYFAQIILLIAGPIALNNIGWKFFFVLLIPTCFNLAFVYFMCPETKGRSLEDINALFGETVAVHYFNATEAEQRELEKAAQVDELEDASRRNSVQSAKEKGIPDSYCEDVNAKL